MTRLFLCRHGETAWSRDGQHTSFSDIPLTERGEEEARALGQRIAGKRFDLVLTSPLIRAQRSCELAGLGARAELEPNAVEWNYGDYEEMTTPEIQQIDPGWTVFKSGGPNGESAADIGARADLSLIHI